jgi:hypothetical protein
MLFILQFCNFDMVMIMDTRIVMNESLKEFQETSHETAEGIWKVYLELN